MPTKTDVVSYRYRYRMQNIYDGTWYTQTFTNVKTGQNNPGWKDRIKKGYNVASPYTSDQVRILNRTTQSGVVHVVGVSQTANGPIISKTTTTIDGVIGSLDFATVTSEVGSLPAAAEAQALSRLYDKMRSEYESAQGLASLGELRETIKMLKRPASALRDLISRDLQTMETVWKRAKKVRRRRGETADQLRRRKQRILYEQYWKTRPGALLDAGSGSWLEWQFGVKPLVSDLGDLATAAIEACTGYATRKRVTGTSDDYPSYFTNGFPTTGYARIVCTDMVRRVTTRSVRYTVGLNPRVNAPLGSFEALRERSGATWGNFVPTLYELMPWSFLIDYFLNVGDILSAAFTSTANVSYVVRTERAVTHGSERKGYLRPQPDDAYNKTLSFTAPYGTAGELEVMRTRLTRTVPSSLPLPPLVARLPDLSSESKKYWNMAALLVQARKKFTF